MKYLYLILLFSSFTFGQKFELTSTGFVNAEDNSKNYVVIESPGKTQSELYKQTLIMLNKKYKSAKDVVSGVEPETITVNALAAKQIRRTGMHSFKNQYNVVISFKDGKIKVDAPTFELYTFDYGKKQVMMLDGGFSLDGSYFGIYNKKGVVKIEKAVEDLNAFANSFVEDIKNAGTNSDW
ncbi:DUF4468 domain-containing protein [Chishuiella changwenlii]|uniref:DUF4468 domain-containing protein n=1 Tax=Chishuiella changwenlii TaxID=1434701 RepID=UPI002FD8DB8B